MSDENTQLERRDDDEIVNQPVVENRYNATVSLCGLILHNETGNSISYEEIRDYEKSTFPIRKLSITLKDKEIFEVLNYKKDENGLLDLTMLVYSNDEGNLMMNKPFNDGKFKAMIKDGDTNISLRETMDDTSISKGADMFANIVMTFYLFREDEIDSLDDDNVNFLINGAPLKNVLAFLFEKFTPYKYIISDPDHNPDTGRFLMPQLSFPAALKLIDVDMGIYKTDYILFLDEGVLYLLNKDNDMKCRNTKLEFSLNVLMSKPGDDMYPATVDKLSNGNYTVIVGQQDVNISRNVSNKINESLSYIFPNGTKHKNKNMLSRNVKTIRKITNVTPLEKYKNKLREDITISLNNISMKNFNPMSTIFFTDSQNKRREYRVGGIKITFEARKSITLKIKGFRILEEGE